MLHLRIFRFDDVADDGDLEDEEDEGGGYDVDEERQDDVKWRPGEGVGRNE